MRVSDITILREAPEDLAKLKAAIAHLKDKPQGQSAPAQSTPRPSAASTPTPAGDMYARIDGVIERATSYKDIKDALNNIPVELATGDRFQQLKLRTRLVGYVNRKYLGGSDTNFSVDTVQVAKQVFQKKSDQAQPDRVEREF